MPALINTSNNVLPPYSSPMDPITSLSRGTFNASDYGERWTSHPGSLLPCGMVGGKRRTKSSRRNKQKVRFTKRRKTVARKKRRGRTTKVKK